MRGGNTSSYELINILILWSEMIHDIFQLHFKWLYLFYWKWNLCWMFKLICSFKWDIILTVLRVSCFTASVTYHFSWNFIQIFLLEVLIFIWFRVNLFSIHIHFAINSFFFVLFIIITHINWTHLIENIGNCEHI